MRVLGRQLVDPFGKFWNAFTSEMPVSADEVERGLASVFGDQGVEYSGGFAPRWMSLPDDDLAYHVAHELTHMLMRTRGYPKTVRGADYPSGSAEARVGEDLEEMVLHPSLHEIIEPFGFRRDYISEVMASGAMNGVGSAPPPEYGTPWHFTWAIRHCLLSMELPHTLWTPLETLYAERAPDAARLGQELREAMENAGWGTPERALDAMARTRDLLGLDVQDKVLVLDTATGRVF